MTLATLMQRMMLGGQAAAPPALNFNGSDIYGKFTHPWSGVSGDEIDITFNTSTAGANAALIPSAQFTSSDTLSLTGCTATISGDAVAHGADISSYLDGNDHVMILTLTAGVTVTYYGQNGSSANYFDGQLPVVKFIDKSGAEDVTKIYSIDSGSTLYVPIAGGSLGSELVASGGFDTDNGDWTKGTGWTVSSGVGVSDGANGNQPLYQALTLVDGEPYLFGTTMNRTSGWLTIQEIGVATQSHNYSTSGEHSHTFIADKVSTLIVHRSNSGSPYDGTVDNTTVKQLPESMLLYGVEDDDWS